MLLIDSMLLVGDSETQRGKNLTTHTVLSRPGCHSIPLLLGCTVLHLDSKSVAFGRFDNCGDEQEVVSTWH